MFVIHFVQHLDVLETSVIKAICALENVLFVSLYWSYINHLTIQRLDEVQLLFFFLRDRSICNNYVCK